ncbi:LysR family transcriptional regulator [Thermotalea metallivorans]|uniref:HTH-type transcriptional regulator GltR n=1 Tax=Thermotalea metallivorans TaxID=520762 RepID=A0A140L054_9FIRM|nr:LysR family transcriptional regulator [Thermotalea metallivorans]KXG73929.1 HTH-type transcriptional regulator GltR [Thermotalea metallivorans]
MELQQLKTFITIAKVSSFTKAAELLDYAQSSVSGQIRALEEEFEVRLFERLGRAVCLTEEGKRLLVYAEQLLKLAEETKDSVTGSTQPRGTLIIGAPESLSVFRLPELLKEYRSRFPNVKLVLKLGSCRDILSWLKKSIIDIAFLMDTPLDVPSLVSKCLCQEQIVLIAGNDHFMTNKNTIELKDLEGEDLILVEEDGCCYRMIFESLMAEAGVYPSSIQEFGSVEMIKKCVISGLGVSILPLISVEKEIRDGQLKEISWSSPDFNIHTQILYCRNKWLSPALSAMIELSKQHIKNKSI